MSYEDHTFYSVKFLDGTDETVITEEYNGELEIWDYKNVEPFDEGYSFPSTVKETLIKKIRFKIKIVCCGDYKKFYEIDIFDSILTDEQLLTICGEWKCGITIEEIKAVLKKSVVL